MVCNSTSGRTATGNRTILVYQVDYAAMELSAYWSGVKQTSYEYFTTPELFALLCGKNEGSIYACLQGIGLFGDLNPAFVGWATLGSRPGQRWYGHV